MGVIADHRGQGLGSALLRTAITWCEVDPRLAWIEMLPYVEEDPRGFWAGLRLGRDIRPEPQH
jgi:GNAT superfamily N-acetyltransferase